MWLFSPKKELDMFIPNSFFSQWCGGCSAPHRLPVLICPACNGFCFAHSTFRVQKSLRKSQKFLQICPCLTFKIISSWAAGNSIYSLLSPPLFLFHLLSSVSVSAALEKKSPNIGSGVEVAPGLAAAAAHSSSSVSRGSGSLQSRGSGGHLSPPLASSFSSAAHQGVKKEPMDHQGIGSSSRSSGISRGFSPDSHAAHQYHAAAAAARATPPHLSHPSPYSAAYPYPEPAKLPPSLSGWTKDTCPPSILTLDNCRTPRWTL